MMEKTPYEQAIEYCANIRFHQSFTLPANPTAGRTSPIRVTYSDRDYRDHHDGPVLLFIGGLMGGRYMAMGASDAIARHHKLRLVSVDKCGMGGTESVPLEFRLPTWLDIVPALLRHLDISHVALLSHSAGTYYLFNTVLTYRHILHPTRPLIILISPWVHPKHSASLKLLSMIPVSLFSAFPSLLKSINANIEPAFAFSSGLFNSLTSCGHDSAVTDDQDQDLPEGIDAATKAMKPALDKMVTDYVCKENIQGVSDESLLLLKRGFTGANYPWGLFNDFDEGVRMIVQQEARLVSEQQREPEVLQKLEVNVYLAESDMMIGKQGGEWFDNCWRPEVLEERIDYESCTVPGTNHDSIIGNVEFGIVFKVFGDVARSFAE